MARSQHSLTVMLGALALAGGCRPDKGPARSVAWTGPTDTLSKVVEDINTNNARVTTLWSFGYFEADIVEREPGKPEPKKPS